MQRRGAFLGQGLHVVRVAVVNDALVVVFHQAARHVCTHPAETDHSDLHNEIQCGSLAGSAQAREKK